MRKFIASHFRRDDVGATAIEYGLIAAGIALVIIAIVAAVGTDLGTLFGTVDTNLTGHGG